MNPDPLQHFFDQFGLDHTSISRIETGQKYLGILLKNGHIGVCSTLNSGIKAEELPSSNLDLSLRSHRIFYNAYLNATLNYSITPEKELDIFDHLDFSSRKAIVMIGYFRPLARKFFEKDIPLHIFDKVEDDPELTPMDQMVEKLGEAKNVILTATTIFDGTFSSLLEKTNAGADVFLLGPSSILHPDMKTYRNIKKVYGALFQTDDHGILDIIKAGNGTRTFLKFGKKVNI